MAIVLLLLVGLARNLTLCSVQAPWCLLLLRSVAAACRNHGDVSKGMGGLLYFRLRCDWRGCQRHGDGKFRHDETRNRPLRIIHHSPSIIVIFRRSGGSISVYEKAVRVGTCKVKKTLFND